MEIYLFDFIFRIKFWKCIGLVIIIFYKLLNKLFKNNGSILRFYNLIKEVLYVFFNV